MNGTLTIILVVVAALALLKYGKQLLAKVFGVLVIGGLIIGFMYKNSYGPFKQNIADLEHLQQKYCGPDGDTDICDCILNPAIDDIANRFTKIERDSLKYQKIKAAYVLQKSLRVTKEASLICLASKGATEKYKVFLQDFVPIENKYLDKVGETARDIGEKLKGEVANFKSNKENIDSKY